MKLSKFHHRVWRYKIRQLRKHFPSVVPIEIKSVPLKGVQADCAGVVKLGRLVKIIIRIDSKARWAAKVDSLMHEWAHAMEWEAYSLEDSPKKDHGETWGVWYAKIYQHLVDKCWVDMKERKLLSRNQLAST
jgi:hypothetical protein